MFERIREELRNIEQSHGVKILYACESGSRAWGFPSKDSDYDVRFIYVHKPDWYLAIDQQADVIEVSLDDGMLDMSGWDLQKALKLYRKSNPSLHEWLESPIVYLEQDDFLHNMLQLQGEVFSPFVCFNHYLSMAENTYMNDLMQDEVRAKKYFYALRPIFACWWIEENGTMPPIPFDELLDSSVPRETPLYEAISELLFAKMQSDERDVVPKNRLLNMFISECVEEFHEYAKTLEKRNHDVTPLLNRFFMHTLKKAWK